MSSLASRSTPSSAKTQALGGPCECGGKSAGSSVACEPGQKEDRLSECLREWPEEEREFLLHGGKCVGGSVNKAGGGWLATRGWGSLDLRVH